MSGNWSGQRVREIRGSLVPRCHRPAGGGGGPNQDCPNGFTDADTASRFQTEIGRPNNRSSQAVTIDPEIAA